MPSKWIAGNGDCAQASGWLVHEYSPSFHILRQSGCSHYEKPFLYLLLGTQRALLQDTGAGKTPGTAEVIRPLLEKLKISELLVVHSHGHGDHTAGDAELAKLPKVTVIAPKVEELTKAFGIEKWPDGLGRIDLGDRILDAIPIPGHDAVSLALYDRKSGVLLTGDSVYSGRLYVTDLPEYWRSIQRLVEFTRGKPVSHVLGTHIEQMRAPFRDYKVGTTYQPDEHALELSRGHLLELAEALADNGNELKNIVLRDFTIVPRKPRNSSPPIN